MSKTILLIVVLGLRTILLAENISTKFQVAIKLCHQGKYAEAETAFLNLTRKKIKPQGRDMAFFYAANCATAQKKYKRTEELAADIKSDPLRKLCLMILNDRQRKWHEVIEICQDENFETWPDRLIHDAAMYRGKAYAAKKMNTEAEKDFLLAKNSTMDHNDLAFANVALGKLYRDQLKDEEKAFAAFGEAIKLRARLGIKSEGVTSYARLLAKRGKVEQALAELDKRNVEKISSPYWKCRIYCCYGDVYKAMGKTAKALEYYQKALAVAEIPKNLVNDVKMKITDLEKTNQK